MGRKAAGEGRGTGGAGGPPASAGPSLAGVEAAARGARGAGPAPVHLWNPPYCGEIGLAIAGDGSWHYRDSPIRRPALVRLFASVLRKDDDGRHYLVTPVEKIGVDVADVAFQAVEMTVEGEGRRQRLRFRTNVGDEAVAGPAHPLRFERDPATEGLRPYVLIRGRLEARLTRSVAYDLAQFVAEEAPGGRIGVWSGGAFFAIADSLA